MAMTESGIRLHEVDTSSWSQEVTAKCTSKWESVVKVALPRNAYTDAEAFRLLIKGNGVLMLFTNIPQVDIVRMMCQIKTKEMHTTLFLFLKATPTVC